MKIRKSLVAVASALALSTAGVSVATAETTDPSLESEQTTSSSLSSSNNNTEEGEGTTIDPKDITAWISVFTAFIGALGAAYSFYLRVTR